MTSTCSILALVFDSELNRVSGGEVCCTVIFTRLLSNVENLPKIGPAALLPTYKGGGEGGAGALRGVASGSGRAGGGGPPFGGGETCP